MNSELTQTCISYYLSPLGWLKVSVNAMAVTEVLFCEEKQEEADKQDACTKSNIMRACFQQLDEYFRGSRTIFDLPLLQNGTPFQQSVWKALTDIPFGSTISYLELSKRLGNTKAIRAAAATNGKNKIAILVPCHRVIGSNQSLVGYAGGLEKKKWLLEHELKFTHGLQTLF